MNLIAATLAVGGEDRFPRLASVVEDLYGDRLASPLQSEGSGRIGAIYDGGIVLGRAARKRAGLLLLGGLHGPTPGWDRPGRPPDDADTAADWLLQRYLDEGGAFLDGIYGQYAVIVCDRGGNRLRAACDAKGIRTLFLHEDQRGPTLASNLFVLARSLRDRVEPDRSLEDFFLVYGYLPGSRTIFEGIRSLQPGVLHTWEQSELQRREIRTTEDSWAEGFLPEDPGAASEEEVQESLYQAFMTSTEEQTGSDSKAAVLLGGVDSALVAAALSRLGKEVHTYSFHYRDPGYDQPHTDSVSEYLGSQHHWVEITPEVIREGLEEYGLTFSRPTNWPNYVIQTARVCEVIRDHGILHVHSGDGCDSIFLGYPRTHVLAKVYQRLPRFPPTLNRLVVRLLDQGWMEDLLGRSYRVGMNVLRNVARPMPQRGFLTFRVFDESSLDRLRAGDAPDQAFGIEEMLRRLTRGLQDLSPDELAYRGKTGVSANKAKLGGSSDRTGTITHAPYLHPGLKCFSQRLPERLLRRDEDPETAVTGKYVLLHMAAERELLPRRVIFQEKLSAVDAPMDAWLRGPLHAVTADLLDHLPFDAEHDYVERLLTPQLADRLYARFVSTDDLTTHEASLLATYAALARALD